MIFDNLLIKLRKQANALRALIGHPLRLHRRPWQQNGRRVRERNVGAKVHPDFQVSD